MDDRYTSIFSPFKIGTVTIKNRIVMCPMGGTGLINRNEFNERARDFFIERAKGGVGLIVAGCSQVRDQWGRDLWLNDAEDVFLGPIKETVEEIHKYGTRIFMQLGVGMGRVLNVDVFDQIPDSDIESAVFAVNDLANYWNPKIHHYGLSVKEIKRLVRATAETALLAKKAGIDGVEIHAVHEGYLLDQFAIANMNSRTDEYGGSLENRMRFACEVIKAIKELCGKNFPVSVRYSVVSKIKAFHEGALPGEEYDEFGRTLEESPAVAKLLEEAGCDCFNADNGTYDSWYWAHPPVYMQKACNLAECEYLKKHVSVPVICAGRMEDPDIAAAAIAENKVDAIGVARQFLADPYWVNKVKEGRKEEILPCIACHAGCLGGLMQKKGVSCALNPAAMHEEEYKIIPAEKAKKVVIIGGGIGGMEAARVLKLRGHNPVIFEKDERLGGVFNAAAAPFFKEADRALIQWYSKQMESIDVRLGTEATAEAVKAEAPDFVIIATGATPKLPDFPDCTQDNVITAIDFLEGRKPTGQKVAVIGGGLTGCEIAYTLLLQGKEATIVEMMDGILLTKGLCAANKDMLEDLLKYHNAHIYTDTKVLSFMDGNLKVERKGIEKNIEADTIIIAAGYTPNASLKETLAGAFDYEVIGDADTVGNLMTVIKQANDVARRI